MSLLSAVAAGTPQPASSQFLAERWPGATESELCRLEGVVQTLLAELQSLPLYEVLAQSGLRRDASPAAPGGGGLRVPQAPLGSVSNGGAGDTAGERPGIGAKSGLKACCATHGGDAAPPAAVAAASGSNAADAPGQRSAGPYHEAPSRAAGAVTQAGSMAEGAAGGTSHVDASNRWEQLCLLMLLVPREVWQPITDPKVRAQVVV